MRPTLIACSKASRRALTPKRGNKDFYKGTRQSHPPGIGFRTGPPGKHVIGGASKYRLVDEQVRVFVAPPIQDIVNSPLKPYVDPAVRLTTSQQRKPYGRLPHGGLTPARFYEIAPKGVQVLREIKTRITTLDPVKKAAAKAETASPSS